MTNNIPIISGIKTGDKLNKPKVNKVYNPLITRSEAIKQGGYYDQEGLWNSILTFKDDPKRLYRGRVECLIIKDNMVYLRKKTGNTYRIPGGSFENNNDNMTQCYNECKEEARIIIKNIKNTGITYRKTFAQPADWTAHLPIRWSGQYCEVYVAEFDKHYDGNVNTKVRDDDMYNNGSFYDIDSVYDILTDEHKDAIDRYVRAVNENIVMVKTEYNTDSDKIDIAKKWVDNTGLAMIYSADRLSDCNIDKALENLNRVYNDFIQMSSHSKKQSNQMSISLFGFDNITHYNIIKSHLLSQDCSEVDMDYTYNSRTSDGNITESLSISDELKRPMNIILKELSSDYDKVEIFNMLENLNIFTKNFTDSVAVNRFTDKITEYIKKDDIVLLPYFSPGEMEELGVFNQDEENNYYGKSDSSIKEWYEIYKATGHPGNDWYNKVNKIYTETLLDPSADNKQRLLEYGWNPEIRLTIDVVKKISETTKLKLSDYTVDMINITEGFDLDDMKEIAYISKNLKKYNLQDYLVDRTIDINETKGKLFVDYDDKYVAHISTIGNTVVGIGTWSKGVNYLKDMISLVKKDLKDVSKDIIVLCKKDNTQLLKALKSDLWYHRENEDTDNFYVYSALIATSIEKDKLDDIMDIHESSNSIPVEEIAVASKYLSRPRVSPRDVIEKLNPVYIVSTHTGSPFGKIVKGVTKDFYTHAALGFDSALDKLYSFSITNGSKKGGLSQESLKGYVQNNGEAEIDVAVVYLKEKDYRVLRDKLDILIHNIDKTSYSIKNLFNILINKTVNSKKQFSMICSQFVDSMFKIINVDITNKPSNLVTPGDLSRVKNPKVYKVYEGKARNYNKKTIDSKLYRLRNIIEPIKETVFLSNTMDGVYIAVPVLEAKEFPVGFDEDGSLLIKNYKSLDFETEYIKSNKLLKSYKANGSWYPMAYELCKLWFMNTILLKKIERADRLRRYEEKESYVKIRAKIMNDFTIYLNILNEHESKNGKGFNFSEYYDRTPFSDTTIRISGSTLKYTKHYLKQLFI